jgi:redox-sensitive bicupin YhaK (pirin superfamily)
MPSILMWLTRGPAGQQGLVKATGVVWMCAGGGTWQKGRLHPLGPCVTFFQLWVVLPPELENGPAEGMYVTPEAVPQLGQVRLLLNRYGEDCNPVRRRLPISNSR